MSQEITAAHGFSAKTTSVSPRAAQDFRPPLVSDWGLLVISLLMVAFGLIMVYSATGVRATEQFNDAFIYVRKQCIAAVVGIGLLAVFSRVPIWLLRKLSPFLMICSILLLVCPLIPGLGERAGGAQRWIVFAGFRFQPVELAKLCFLIFMAGYFSRHESELHRFVQGVIIPVLLFVPMAVLLLGQPDFGSTAVTAIVVLSMAMVSGVRLKFIGYAGLGLIVVGGLLVYISPYRMSRVVSFMSPFNDASGKGYQLIQSLIAVGIGDIFGVGLGASQQKLFFLPAAHTDFIFALIGEELGFVGCCSLLAALSYFIWRGFKIAISVSHDTFLFSLAIGLTLLIGAPALLNVGVVTGLLPTKGMVFPFVGYGGSSLICSLAAVGLLLAVGRGGQLGGAPQKSTVRVAKTT